MLEASPHVRAVFRGIKEYSSSENAALVILDRFRPPALPKVDSIWIDPPAGGSPIPVRKTVSQAPLTRWHSEHPLGEGLRSKDLTLESATVFEAAPDDIRIAEVEAGPVIVARPGKPKNRGDRIPSGAARPCATSWRRRSCSPTRCAGWRRIFSAAGS